MTDPEREALPALAVAALEELIDAKIAFAAMTPEQRRPLIDALQRKRDKAVDRFALAMTTQKGSDNA